MTRDELILSATTQAERIAAEVCRRIGRRIGTDDLTQIGMLGAIKAAENYDPSRGVQFKTYAEYKIRGAIMDAVREAAGRKLKRRGEVVSLDAKRDERGRAIEYADPHDYEHEWIEADYARSRHEWLTNAMQSLTPPQRRVIQHMLDGVPTELIAYAEMIRESTVYMHRKKAIVRLRRMAAAA